MKKKIFIHCLVILKSRPQHQYQYLNTEVIVCVVGVPERTSAPCVFQVSSSSFLCGGCWGGGGGGGVVGQVGVLLMLHSDQSFQGTPVQLDSRTDTRPENRQTIK